MTMPRTVHLAIHLFARSVFFFVRKVTPRRLRNALKKRDERIKSATRAERKALAVKQHGTFGTAELVAHVRDMGVDPGSVVFAQGSLNDMYTFSGSPLDFLRALLATAGKGGTLLMPVYTRHYAMTPPPVFDVKTAPTYCGIVNEMLRRTPGAVRSMHPRHSICGVGPLAQGLLQGHETCEFADGVGSPFDRLRTRDDAFILTYGLPPTYCSFLHWVEDIDPSALPFRVHQKTAREFRVRDPEGNERAVPDYLKIRYISSLLELSGISSRLSPEVMIDASYKGVPMWIYPVKAFADELLALRDRGIIHYR